MAGNSWEGFVVEQIISNLNNQCIPFYYRTQTGSELDLCIMKGNEIVATFENKLSNNPKISRGNTESITDLKTTNNFIVTFSAGDYALNDKWQVYDLNSIEKHLLRLGLKEENK